MIRGRTIDLKKLRMKDLSYILKWWQNQDLMRFYDRLPVHSPQELKEELMRNISASNRLDFLIETKTSEPVGITYLEKINWRDRHCKLHVMIGQTDQKNMFFGAEAEFHLLRYAFHQLNMHKVYGSVMEYASAAERLMKDMGFIEEAVLKDLSYQNGRYWDVHLYGLLDREFDAFINTSKGKRYLAASQEGIQTRKRQYRDSNVATTAENGGCPSKNIRR
jgi:RimJ/RimL family protein N-acetyltransferase